MQTLVAMDNQDRITMVLKPTPLSSNNVNMKPRPRSSYIEVPINLISQEVCGEIKTKRSRARLTQQQLAARLNIKLKVIEDIESRITLENTYSQLRIIKYLDHVIADVESSRASMHADVVSSNN